MSQNQPFRMESIINWVIPTNDRLRKVNLFSVTLILLFGVWYTTSHQVRRWSVDAKNWSDYSMHLNTSLDVVNHLVYPTLPNGFFYPPPFAILRVWLGELGLEASGILWMVLLIISLFGIFEASLSLLGLSNHPAKYLFALLALMSVEYWVEFDLRALNVNLLYLASLLLVLAFSFKAKPYAAGFFLALSIVLKLYSFVFLPYFLLKRQYRLCLAAALWLGVFFIVLPIAYLGMNGAVALTMSWVQSVRGSGESTNFPWELNGYIISLHKTLLTVLTERGGKGLDNIINISEERVLFVTQVAQFLWLILVAFYFWFSRRRPFPIHVGPGMMMDAGVLTLLTLPFSPVLQPHHGVMMLIPAILLVAVVLDPKQSPSLRWPTLAVALTCGLTTQFGPSGSIRGLGMIISIVLFMCGLIMVRLAGYRSVSMQSGEPVAGQ
jgi:hypothetical protein